MLPVVASHRCGFLNSRPTVLPLHMHVYLIRSCFPREWDVRPVCEQCFYWGHFSQCQVGKMKNDKSWCKCELTAGIFFCQKAFMACFSTALGNMSQWVNFSSRTFKRLSRIKDGTGKDCLRALALQPENYLIILWVPGGTQGLALEGDWYFF